MATRPQTLGGTISVSDSAELATLEVNGLPIGTQVWNADVEAYFKLTVSTAVPIEIDPSDGYDDPTWTFANADFTDHEGCTLDVRLDSPNDSFSGRYVIETVQSATEVDVVDPPAGATDGEISGTAILYLDALVEDAVVEVSGVFGVRWVIVSSGATVTTDATLDGDGSELDPLSVVSAPAVTLSGAGVAGKTSGGSGLSTTLGFAALSAQEAAADVTTTTLLAASDTIAVTGLDGDTDGDYDMYFHISAAATTGVITLQINGAATNLYSHWVAFIQGSGTVSGRNAAAAQVGPTMGAAGNLSGWIRLRSRTGGPGSVGWRSGHAETNSEVGPGGFFVNIIYTDETTNITSLSLVGNTDSFDVGSYLTVRKLRNPS